MNADEGLVVCENALVFSCTNILQKGHATLRISESAHMTGSNVLATTSQSPHSWTILTPHLHSQAA